MKLYVGVTDNNWFDFLSKIPNLDEVNFWQPSPKHKDLQSGELFLFKLHSPRNYIAGGGFFAHWTQLPIGLAWEAFEEKNGTPTYEHLRKAILQYRKIQDKPFEDIQMGCILLEQPFFFDEKDWFVPPGWKPGIRVGKSYSCEEEDGKAIWQRVQSLLTEKHAIFQETQIAEQHARYGEGILTRPRLGQGSFRILVTDAYKRSCAITEEHSLPVLEAAHIKPFSIGGFHQVNNGILLRSDVHRLFDKGYMTVTSELRIEVSRRLRDEFENGRYYYPFHGKKLHHLPINPLDHPSSKLLIWHNENVFKG